MRSARDEEIEERDGERSEELQQRGASRAKSESGAGAETEPDRPRRPRPPSASPVLVAEISKAARGTQLKYKRRRPLSGTGRLGRRRA